MTEAGARVWAARSADQDTVWAFGFGTYAGDFPYPGRVSEEDRKIAEAAIRRRDERPPAQGFEEYEAADRAKPMAERVDDLLLAISLNPKIVLDGNTGIVWGCECWWGEADSVTPQEWAKGRKIVTVPDLYI